jgi:hypothetical protein
MADLFHKNLRRRTDEIDYWRKKAGWYDDDVAMQQYNNGQDYSGNGTSTNSGGDKNGSYNRSGSSGGISMKLKFIAATISIVIAVIVFQHLSKRSRRKKASSAASGVSRVSRVSRSTSRSRTRSRSGSRTRRPPADDYHRMDDKKEPRTKSKEPRTQSDDRTARSSRSKSRDGKSGRKPSRSNSRSRRHPKELV